MYHYHPHDDLEQCLERLLRPRSELRAAMTEPHDDEIVHRELDTDREEPAVEIAEAVADLEGTPATELPAIYDCIDGMLSGLYSNPPALEAQMKVEFTYNGYRITVDQSGTAEFVHVT